MKYLNLAGEIKNSLSNGPGNIMRYVLFSQGCPHHCKGCHNKHTWEFKDNFIISTDTCLQKIKANIPIIKGVTFSGGEPFSQPEAFLDLAIKLKKETNLNICCYTGYLYKDLLNSKDNNILNLLKYIDVLIDGKFDEELKGGIHPFIGSSNQNIYFLKNGKIISDNGSENNV